MKRKCAGFPEAGACQAEAQASAYFCVACDELRIRHIDERMAAMARKFGKESA